MQNGKLISFLALLVLLGAIAAVNAAEDAAVSPLQAWVEDNDRSEWSGASELWVDPSGNDAELSDATFLVLSDGIVYRWSYKGDQQSGELRWGDDGLQWKDSWHQPEFVPLRRVPGHGSLLAAEYAYPAGSGPDWHWRIKFAQRPDEALVLQMTNIASWGEEARAVRMVVHRAEHH